MNSDKSRVVTVTLNPAIDQTITIPHFAAGKVNRVEEVRSNAGGKGVNVASVLADAGHRVEATGFLGRENAEPFEELFRRKGIADTFVRIAGQTRVGIKITDPADKQTTDINFAGAAPSSDDLRSLRESLLPAGSANEGTWFVLAGSVPPGVPPGIYGELTRDLRANGARVVLDTSGEPLRLALKTAPPQILKPNIHELEDFAGRPLPDRDAVLAAARELLDRGAELVAVSLGADGALFVTRENVVVARPPEVEVKSTVGAGDAMVAGIVAGQVRGLSLRDCARLATAFAVDALSRLEPGLTSPEAVESARLRVTVE